MKCPDCSKILADDALSCRCGWSKRGAAGRPFAHCAHETCDIPAICKVNTPTGWANFCLPHYEMYFDNIARQNFTDRGLDRGLNETREDHAKRVMAWLKQRAKLKTFADATKAEDEWAA